MYLFACYVAGHVGADFIAVVNLLQRPEAHKRRNKQPRYLTVRFKFKKTKVSQVAIDLSVKKKKNKQNKEQ